MTTANIIPPALTDGIVYALAVPLVAQEASLGDAIRTPDPIAVAEGHAIVAVVKLTCAGHISGANAFVFLQTDLGDGTWIDVAWCYSNKTDGTTTFVLCGGGVGAMNNAFQQSRAAGSAPATQANGSNALPLGGRCRFSGFASSVGGSSNLAGVTAGITATITYKIINPR